MNLAKQLTFLRRVAHELDSKASAERALELVRLGAPFDSMFFAEIRDPAWLDILESRGFFDLDPEPVRNEDGSISHPRSQALRALEELAPQNPELAARIITKLPHSANVSVGDQIMRCMIAINDQDSISAIYPVAASLATSKKRSSRLFLRDLCVSWIELGCTKEAIDLLSAFVESVVCEGEDIEKDQQIAWEFTECDTHILKPLIESSPDAVTDLCFKALRLYYDSANPRKNELSEALEDVLEPEAYDIRDHIYWLEDFHKVGLYRDDIRAILARRLFSALIKIYNTDDASRARYDRELRSHPWQLFNRLRYQLYADAPETTLDFARNDAISALEGLSLTSNRHCFEFASMLESQAKTHGYDFLTQEEVDQFTAKVLEGPINSDGKPDADERYQKHFWSLQLWPIRDLLSDELKQKIDEWRTTPDKKRLGVDLDAYKPFRSYGRSGAIKDKSPYTVEDLQSRTDESLYHELNTWRNTKDWIEDDELIQESDRELAMTFAKLIAKEPERFSASSEWWKRLQRPVMLAVPLERWAKALNEEQKEGVEPLRPIDPEIAFGVIQYISANSQESSCSEESKKYESDDADWERSRFEAVRYLKAFIKNNPPHHEWSDNVKTLLTQFASDPEKQLDSPKQSNYQDWQFKAINSVRGDAWEAIIHLALKEKNYPEQGQGSVSSWISDLLSERLDPSVSESPAIYSLFGSQLRLLAYVVPGWIQDHKDLLLPRDRKGNLEALIDGHLAYDQPHKFVADVIPEFLSVALDVSEERAKANGGTDTETEQNTRDVSSRLGFHICFYFWNDWFKDASDGKALFERFLNVAGPQARAETLSYIGNAFDKAEPSPEIQPLIGRAQGLVTDWLEFIKTQASGGKLNVGILDAELMQFADLIAAECFPFDWRVETASAALGLMERTRYSYQFLDTLEKWSESEDENPDKIRAGIQLLSAVTNELSDELRWSIQIQRLNPIFRAGMKHEDEAVRTQTNMIIENLLRQGFFKLLDLVETHSS